ncbi:hypothetical protein HEP_00509000, partial [Hepatocystis sp. ex Piliocolobus tephrosceles]
IAYSACLEIFGCWLHLKQVYVKGAPVFDSGDGSGFTYKSHIEFTRYSFALYADLGLSLREGGPGFRLRVTEEALPIKSHIEFTRYSFALYADLGLSIGPS